MTKEHWQYVAMGAALVAAYFWYRDSKLRKALTAPENAASLASASAAVKKDLGLS